MNDKLKLLAVLILALLDGGLTAYELDSFSHIGFYEGNPIIDQMSGQFGVATTMWLRAAHLLFCVIIIAGGLQLGVKWVKFCLNPLLIVQTFIITLHLVLINYMWGQL